ncbi:hypothetical protein STEG23_036898, partial [Scotinomys teguina]
MVGKTGLYYQQPNLDLKNPECLTEMMLVTILSISRQTTSRAHERERSSGSWSYRELEKEELVFIKDMTPDTLNIFQWMALHSEIYGQHKLEPMFINLKKEKKRKHEFANEDLSYVLTLASLIISNNLELLKHYLFPRTLLQGNTIPDPPCSWSLCSQWTSTTEVQKTSARTGKANHGESAESGKFNRVRSKPLSLHQGCESCLTT